MIDNAQSEHLMVKLGHLNKLMDSWILAEKYWGQFLKKNVYETISHVRSIEMDFSQMSTMLHKLH